MTIQEFNNNGYVHLKNVLDEKLCKNLTDYLKKLVSQQQTIRDSQCPLSEAVHGAEEFDKLLEQLKPYFEEKLGLNLFPTYSYARLYSFNDELKIHRDREACEISATLTLGFEGDKWAIYMGNNEDKSNSSEIIMEIGDAVLYKGIEKYHWRDKFNGKWQAQVFLHYVNANGPYAEWKYDKRESLGFNKNVIENEIKYYDVAYTFPNAISNDFCNKLIEEYTKPTIKKEVPAMGFGNIKNINLDIRNVQRVPLPINAGIGATLTTIGLNLNYEKWKYNITHSNQAEFLIYDINGKYEAHVDTFHIQSNETRKITVLAILNDDFEGGKFFIQNDFRKIYPKQDKGDIIVFPSFMLHGVEPVTKGIRYTVVTWLVGPYFV